MSRSRAFAVSSSSSASRAVVRHVLAVKKGARVPDLAPDDLFGDFQALLLGEGILAAAHLGDGVLLRHEAAPVAAVLGEVVEHYAVLVGPRHKGRGEVDVAEDVDGVHLAHGKGGDLSLALHGDWYPAAVHAHLGALLGHVNHAVVEDAFTLFAHASRFFFVFSFSSILVSSGRQYCTVLHFSHFLGLSAKSGILSRLMLRMASTTCSTLFLCQSVIVIA